MAAIPDDQPFPASSWMRLSSSWRRRARVAAAIGAGPGCGLGALDSGERKERPSLLLCARSVQYERPSSFTLQVRPNDLLAIETRHEDHQRGTIRDAWRE